jgi:hypothetical protein
MFEYFHQDPLLTFQKQDVRDAEKEEKQRYNHISQLPFHFYQAKRDINNEKSLILDIKNEAKVKLYNRMEKHVEKDKSIDDILKDINRELKEYFNRIKNLKELPSDPEIFRTHHSENRKVGSYTLEPFGRNDNNKFDIYTTKYRAHINSDYSREVHNLISRIKTINENNKMTSNK